MKKTLTILGFLSAVPTGAVLAGEGCFVPMANWQPRHAVAAFAAERGWNVRRIKVDDGCYEIYGHDADGRAIEVTLDPATFAVLDFEYETEHQSAAEDDKSGPEHENEERSDD